MTDMAAATPSISTLLRDRIAERMAELGLSPTDLKNQTGLTGPGLAPVHRGEIRKYQIRLKRPLCAALGWTSDSIDRILAGDEPRLAEPATPDIVARLDALEREISVVRNALAAQDAALDKVASTVELHGQALRMKSPVRKSVAPSKPSQQPSGRKRSGDRPVARSDGAHTPHRGMRRS